MEKRELTKDELLPRVESFLEEIYIGVDGAHLRTEDRKKAIEVAAILLEINRAVRQFASKSELVLMDAAAGKSYVGLLAARFVLEGSPYDAKVICLEREPARVRRSRAAIRLMGSPISIECRQGDVADLSHWPESPSIVVALHACGSAADFIIQNTVAAGARMLLLVPCCTANDLASAQRGQVWADSLQVPRQAPVRRRFIQACVDSERTWRLEAAGYETEVVEFVGATITPHNLLWRARRVCEPSRVAKARQAYNRWNPTD